MNLNQYGWKNNFEKAFEQYKLLGLKPGRIYLENKNCYRIYAGEGEFEARVSGKFQFNAKGKGDFPAVGDWVAVSLREDEGTATIHAILPRLSSFSRKNAGNVTEEQILAANFDYVFIITSLNNNFNLRRIERYLTIAWESGGMPVVILSKMDLCENTAELAAKVEAIAPGVEVHTISAQTGEGIEALLKYVEPGITITSVGSSGVGKSTLLNRLAGEELMETSEIREEDSRGRHTTTHRELFVLKNGGIIIDTPGTRELGLWDAEEGINEAFEDIDEIAKECKFSNCRHENEPGCRVQKAIKEGLLDEKRLESYQKLLRELKFIEGKQKKKERILIKNSRR